MAARRHGFGLLAVEAEDGARLPELQHEQHRRDAAERAQDVGELRSHEVRDLELDDREGDAADEHGRQHLERLFQPAITTTRYIGMISEIIAQSRPTIALSGITGRPVMPASVVTGMPIEPKATGAVLAIRQMPAA